MWDRDLGLVLGREPGRDAFTDRPYVLIKGVAERGKETNTRIICFGALSEDIRSSSHSPKGEE